MSSPPGRQRGIGVPWGCPRPSTPPMHCSGALPHSQRAAPWRLRSRRWATQPALHAMPAQLAPALAIHLPLPCLQFKAWAVAPCQPQTFWILHGGRRPCKPETVKMAVDTLLMFLGFVSMAYTSLVLSTTLLLEPVLIAEFVVGAWLGMGNGGGMVGCAATTDHAVACAGVPALAVRRRRLHSQLLGEAGHLHQVACQPSLLPHSQHHVGQPSGRVAQGEQGWAAHACSNMQLCTCAVRTAPLTPPIPPALQRDVQRVAEQEGRAQKKIASRKSE
jgi:hypothetical protein